MKLSTQTICRRIDCLPLAVELAAARIRSLTPSALRERLSSRLTLRTGGPRDLPARQQTQRETLDWSAGLLADEERDLQDLVGIGLGEHLRRGERKPRDQGRGQMKRTHQRTFSISPAIDSGVSLGA